MLGETHELETGPRSSPVGESDVPSPSKRTKGLVLTRHLDQSIMIGEAIEVQVVGLRSNMVRLKIVAPRSIPVHRREIYDAIRTAPEVDRRPEQAGGATGGLVLARSAGQSIMIGDEVEIEVVAIRPATVRLRIDAPRSVEVHRREVFDSIRLGPH